MSRRRVRKDPVTPETRAAVFQRDQGCVAPRLGAGTPCGGRWGGPVRFASDLSLDHVQEGYGRMGKRAESVPERLVTLCFHHHLDGWATANRPVLREFLLTVAAPHGEL